jgi:hypothetical protein
VLACSQLRKRSQADFAIDPAAAIETGAVGSSPAGPIVAERVAVRGLHRDGNSAEVSRRARHLSPRPQAARSDAMQLMQTPRHRPPIVGDLDRFNDAFEGRLPSGTTVNLDMVDRSEIAIAVIDVAMWHVKHTKCCPRSAPRNLLDALRVIADSPIPERGCAGELVLALNPVLS